MTREEAIQAYTGPLEPTVEAWFAWAAYRNDLIARGSAPASATRWDPPAELRGEATEHLWQATQTFRQAVERHEALDRAYMKRAGHRVRAAEARAEKRSWERVERMRNRK